MSTREGESTEEHIPFIRNDLFSISFDPEKNPCLVGSRCRSCGRFYFPRRTVCYHCKERSLEDTPLSNRGILEAGVVTHIAPSGFRAPYCAGYVVLPEGIRLFTQLVVEGIAIEQAEKELSAGREVELVIEKIREDDQGNDVISYKFRLI